MLPWRARINFRCLVRAILLTSEAMSAADAGPEDYIDLAETTAFRPETMDGECAT